MRGGEPVVVVAAIREGVAGVHLRDEVVAIEAVADADPSPVADDELSAGVSPIRWRPKGSAPALVIEAGAAKGGERRRVAPGLGDAVAPVAEGVRRAAEAEVFALGTTREPPGALDEPAMVVGQLAPARARRGRPRCGAAGRAPRSTRSTSRSTSRCSAPPGVRLLAR